MISVRYFSGNYPELPALFLAQLDANMRLLARLTIANTSLISAATAVQTYQLPDGTLFPEIHQVVKIDSSVNIVTILPAIGQTVLGSGSLVLFAQYDKAILLYSRATQDWVSL